MLDMANTSYINDFLVDVKALVNAQCIFLLVYTNKNVFDTEVKTFF